MINSEKAIRREYALIFGPTRETDARRVQPSVQEMKEALARWREEQSACDAIKALIAWLDAHPILPGQSKLQIQARAYRERSLRILWDKLASIRDTPK